MKEKRSSMQFFRATAIEAILIILITAFKLMGASIAKADPPVLQTIRPVDTSTLPRSSGAMVPRPMIEVGTGVERVSGSGVRIILKASYNGIGTDDNPYVGYRFFAVDSEVGFTPDSSGNIDVSRVRLSVTPLRHGLGEYHGEDTDDYYVIGTVAPIEFERETSIGIQERVQISLVGFDFSLRAPEPSEGYPFYGLYRVAAQALGYMHQTIDRGFPAGPMTEQGFSIADVRATIGAGYMVEERFVIEWAMADLRATSYVTSHGIGTIYEAASEIRFRFNGDPCPVYSGDDSPRCTPYPEFHRRRLRFDAFVRGGVRGIAPGNGNDWKRAAASVMAGIEIGF